MNEAFKTSSGVASRRVFLSHTSELANYPSGRSFVRAAEEAVIASGNQVLEMSYFPAAPEDPVAHCRRQIARAQVLVSILGFRYGSRIASGGVSFTEMEYRLASEAALPRLAFLLADDAEVPIAAFTDFESASQQSEFRNSILSAQDVTVKTFRTADELKAQLLQSLLTQAVENSDSDPAVRRPWMVPNLTGVEVDRPDLFDPALSILSHGRLPRSQNSLYIEGPGGFGKTTLAKQICHDRTVRQQFPGGTLWTTLGQKVTEAAVASKISSLSAELSGQALPTTDPLLAGSHLGQLLDAREPTLLVIDDVWDHSHLGPFLIGGQACQRLITSRVRRLGASGNDLTVDRMTAAQARAVLTGDGRDFPPGLAERLAAQTGRWPVLLGLAAAAVREHVRRGATVPEATKYVTARLRDLGPTTFDLSISDADWREHAVSATVRATTDLLNGTEAHQYNLLSIFPEDADVPVSVLSMIWTSSGEGDVERLAGKMARLSLVNEGWKSGQPTFQLHNVVRDMLRRRMTREAIEAANSRLISQASVRMHSLSPAAVSGDWWNMPRSEAYMWRYLAYHHREAGQLEDLERLVTDPRWVLAKLEQAHLGPGSIDDDLATTETDVGEELRSLLDKNAHLLAPTEPTWALGDVLLSRLPSDSLSAAELHRYLQARSLPSLMALWPPPDIPSDALLRVVSNSDTTLRACAYSPDAGSLYVGGDNRIVSKVLVPGRSVERTFIGHEGAIWACAVSHDGSQLFTASDDSTLRVWATDSGETLHVLEGHEGPINDVALAADGKWIASASNDGTVRIWETQDFELVATLEGHDGAVRCCATLPDGTLISGGNDRMLRHWNVVDGQQTRAYAGHRDWIWGCACAPDGTWVAAAGDDHTIRLWDVGLGTYLGELVGHRGPVNDCVITPDGDHILSVSDDRTVKLWDANRRSVLKDLHGHSGRIRQMSLSATGAELSTVSNDGTARIWKVETRKGSLEQSVPLPRTETETSWLYTCALSEDGGVLAGGTVGGTVVLHSTLDGQPMRSFQQHEGVVRSCSYSTIESEVLLSAGDDGYARLWRTDSGALLRSFDHGAAINGARTVATHNMLVTSGDDQVTKIWDLSSGQLRAELLGHTDAVWDNAVSPDGNTLATCGDDSTLRVWDSRDYRELLALHGHQRGVNSVAYSPIAPLLASGSDDATLRVWDVTTGRTISVLTGHSRAVVDCAFSSDGSKLMSAGDDRTIILWDTGTWARIGTMRVEWPVSACTWQREDKLFFVAGPFFYGFQWRMP